MIIKKNCIRLSRILIIIKIILNKHLKINCKRQSKTVFMQSKHLNHFEVRA